jgi:RNA polymerase sigma factor (TIGR02999 family)
MMMGKGVPLATFEPCATPVCGESELGRGDITQLLAAARVGDAQASQELFRAVYDELHKIARAHRRRWHGNDTLNTTALIGEAYLKLAGGIDREFDGRAHFFATASQAMRQVLVNYAEMQRAAKRGSDAVAVSLEDVTLVTEASAEELLVVHEVLKAFETEEPRRVRIVECRVFGGMSVEDTALALGISPATVKREWQIAAARIYQQLEPGSSGPSSG